MCVQVLRLELPKTQLHCLDALDLYKQQLCSLHVPPKGTWTGKQTAFEAFLICHHRWTQDIVGRPSSSVWSRRWHTLELWTLLVFSLMPHAAVAAAVAANPDAFTIKVHPCLTCIAFLLLRQGCCVADVMLPYVLGSSLPMAVQLHTSAPVCCYETEAVAVCCRDTGGWPWVVACM